MKREQNFTESKHQGSTVLHISLQLQIYKTRTDAHYTDKYHNGTYVLNDKKTNITRLKFHLNT